MVDQTSVQILGEPRIAKCIASHHKDPLRLTRAKLQPHDRSKITESETISREKQKGWIDTDAHS